VKLGEKEKLQLLIGKKKMTIWLCINGNELNKMKATVNIGPETKQEEKERNSNQRDNT
jgi:hypothetical protein